MMPPETPVVTVVHSLPGRMRVRLSCRPADPGFSETGDKVTKPDVSVCP